jgi:hypothetical protein
MGNFAQKLLRVTFILSNGSTFPAATDGAPANQLTLTGLRTLASILCQGAPAFPTAEIAVFGMAQSDMNAVSALTFQVPGIQKNTIQLEASSDGGASWSTVYAGQIVSANVDYSALPDVALRVHAQMGFFDQLNPATPTSYPNGADVATVISNIATKMGFAFENNGVTGGPGGPLYYPGVLTDQLRDAVLHAGIDQYMEGGLSSGQGVQTIAICPKGAARNGIQPFNLSPASGLVGYPAVDSRGYIHVRAQYNSAFRFGGPLTISGSDVVIDPKAPQTLNSRANGKWLIGQLSHKLEALKFEGAWFSEMLLYPPGQEPPQQ